jgi:hypothetical protein
LKQHGKNQPLEKNKIGDEKKFLILMKKCKQSKSEKIKIRRIISYNVC